MTPHSKVTSPCHSRCTRCCRAGWGSRDPPATQHTARRWSTRCATGAPRKRCTWPLPDLHTSNTGVYIMHRLMQELHLVYLTVPPQMQMRALWAEEMHERCLSEWKHERTVGVTHWWWAWCSPHTSLHIGCWSIRGNRGSSPWRWSADLTAASYSRCIGSTHDATVYLDRSLHLLWWPKGKTHKVTQCHSS